MDTPPLEPLANRLITLGELSSLASVEMPLQNVLELFVSKIHILFHASSLAVWDYNSKAKTVKLRYGHDLSKEMREFCQQPVPVDVFPEVNFAIESVNPWTTEDVNDSPLYGQEDTKRLYQSLKARASIGVPLRALTKLTGALSIYYPEPKSFSREEQALVMAYANALALSLNNIESYANIVQLEHVKSEIVSIVAHQLRTPITTLRGNISLLQDKEIVDNTQDRDKILGDMEKVVAKLRLFVESFLNVKAIDEGQLQTKSELVSANSFVEGILQELHAFAERHKVELVFNRGPEKLMVSLDPMLTKEAVLNVINNAIKYGKQKTIVTVKEEGKETIISVQDDGVGIPKEEQGLVFQKLFRASNVKKHPEASTGLGLFIARQYIEASHGRIWFTSEGVNMGTTFFMAFPNTHE